MTGRRKTVAQWRRELPAFDAAVRVAEQLRAAWPGGGRPVFVNAHVDETTQQVAFVIRGGEGDKAEADRVLGLHGYRPGWEPMMPGLDPPAWRKPI